MKSNYIKLFIIFLMLGGLLGVVACATGGGAGSLAPPSGQPQQTDPEFWKMWQDSRGLG
jgi:hypothetical protein